MTGLDRITSGETVEVTLTARVRELLDRFGARVHWRLSKRIGVLRTGCHPVPGFAGTGMERRVADSIASLRQSVPESTSSGTPSSASGRSYRRTDVVCWSFTEHVRSSHRGLRPGRPGLLRVVHV